MPKLSIEQSVLIDAPATHVYGILSDLGKWRPWNPWLVTEPEARVTVAPGGKSYEWSGELTGKGEMKITSEQPPTEVHLDLTFLVPFRSEAKVSFLVEAHDRQTRVTWSMNSKLPFFLFFLKKPMTTILGMDYQRGLLMLKDFAEKGSVPSRIERLGSSKYLGCDYVGIRTECAMSELGPRMSADFKRLFEWRKDAEVEPAGDPFAVYEKWDVGAGRVTYVAGFPVSGATPTAAGFVSGTIPPLVTYALAHVGEYKHLGNAWSTGMQMARGKKFRQGKHPPFETYPTLPGSVPDHEQRVEIHFPTR